MKYEIIETIYNVKKNNGEVLSINRIKWGRGSKYDLRIWNSDIPLNGIVFSGKELGNMCADILRYQGIKAIIDYDDRDFISNDSLKDIQLKEILDIYPKCVENYNMLKALLNDTYPTYARERNLLLIGFDTNIVKDLNQCKTGLTVTDINKYINRLNNLYGIKIQYALWIIQTWADAFELKCNTKKYLKDYIQKIKELSDSNRSSSTGTAIVTEGQDLFEDKNIQITYLYAKRNRFQGGDGRKLYFIVENKTNKCIKIECEVYVEGLLVNPYCYIGIYGIRSNTKLMESFVLFDEKIPDVYHKDCTVELNLKYYEDSTNTTVYNRKTTYIGRKRIYVQS